jgi:hypothetical protein
MAQQATKPTMRTEVPAEQPEISISHSDIAALAFQLWQDRGSPHGSPEEDWFQAEQELKSKEITTRRATK